MEPIIGTPPESLKLHGGFRIQAPDSSDSGEGSSKKKGEESEGLVAMDVSDERSTPENESSAGPRLDVIAGHLDSSLNGQTEQAAKKKAKKAKKTKELQTPSPAPSEEPQPRAAAAHQPLPVVQGALSLSKPAPVRATGSASNAFQFSAVSELGNLFPVKAFILIDGKRWPTAEHYISSRQYQNPDLFELTVDQLLEYKQSKKAHVRQDWENVKDEVVLFTLRCKFSQISELQDVLLETKSMKLMFIDQDAYWGVGNSEQGPNKLGELLEQVRNEQHRTRGNRNNRNK